MTPVQITTAAAADLSASATLVSAGEDTPRKRRKQTHVPDSNKGWMAFNTVVTIIGLIITNLIAVL